MQKHSTNQDLRAVCCLLLLGITLFIAGCGNGGNSPSQPQPTKPGYSIITIVEKEINSLQHSFHMRAGK